MAKNLHAKIPSTDTLIIRDVNEESTARFIKEARETAKSAGVTDVLPNVVVAENAREIAEKSVSSAPIPLVLQLPGRCTLWLEATTSV
jgi:3-hydroxyisobutyrate dehydrogenase